MGKGDHLWNKLEHGQRVKLSYAQSQKWAKVREAFGIEDTVTAPEPPKPSTPRNRQERREERRRRGLFSKVKRS